MADRKAELEAKKAKLQAIREEKERRRKEKALKDAEEAAQRTMHPDKVQDLDEMLSSLGVAPVSDVLSSLSSISPKTTDQNSTPDASLQSNATSTASRPKAPQLSVVNVQTTSILPKEVVTYSKPTQTDPASHERDAAHAFGYYDEYNLNPGLEWEDEFTAEDEENSLGPHLDGFHSKLPPGILPHGLPQVKDVQPAVTSLETEEKKEKEKKPPRDLSEEEKMTIILSPDFQKFMDRAGRIVERALSESVDIYMDYAGLLDSEDRGEEKAKKMLSPVRTFVDERWTKNQLVTSMDWSPQFPELMVASYYRNVDSTHDPDGVCLVWNTKFKKQTPEYVFHCQSAVLSATFARFHPSLIFGGTYSGQVVLWDNRVQKRSPVQRTPLSAAAHTHPVYCLSVIGTQNAHNLISISTDGKVCSWSLDMLSQPQESLVLMNNKMSKPVTVLCHDFLYNDINNFVLGCEEGTTYSTCRHGTKAGHTEAYEGHQAPVTGIDTHKVQGNIDFSNLFITSSFDWTVKLWNLKENKPIHSFEDNGDYVMDVKWSPIHPALFASVDTDGRVDLWNINTDTEVPTASTCVEGNPALNRVSWKPSGTHVCVGDAQGKISVFEVNEKLAQPKHDEFSKLRHTLQELKHNKHDEDLDKFSSHNTSSGPSSLTSLISR
ncbi:cytoplasmic dynein 1 intermediate chain isoform X2 [Bemisia tabaci]|uniref:cytoplasmic dynein 1 intermediate chain isoform X2 n=1 Tax=Bemisia tabaci TaxID=7038 RepID=UPI0008F9CD8E|nr:PREDICTED: cytoplasmic dynein 1 intermediate chain isoform X2 [Bemisia tabaci]